MIKTFLLRHTPDRLKEADYNRKLPVDIALGAISAKWLTSRYLLVSLLDGLSADSEC